MIVNENCLFNRVFFWVYIENLEAWDYTGINLDYTETAWVPKSARCQSLCSKIYDMKWITKNDIEFMDKLIFKEPQPLC